MNFISQDIYLPTPEQTLNFGTSLSKIGLTNLVIFLEGDLGCGKTTFVRGFLQGLDYFDKVKSPTYNIIEEYLISGINIYHFDLYRFQDAQEWIDCGFDDVLSSHGGIIFIEWASLALEFLPVADLVVHFSILNDKEGRVCKILPKTLNGNNIYKKWKALLEEV